MNKSVPCFGEYSVSDSNLKPPSSECPVCKSDAALVPVLTLQIDPLVTLRKCRSCGAASADRMPRVEYLNELYNPSRYEADLVSNDILTHGCAKHIARLIEVSSREKISILDFGGSDGSLALALKQELKRRGSTADIDCTLVDLYDPELPSDILKFIHAFDFSNKKETYDIILASAVIEHLPNIHDVMNQLLGCGSKGAYFYARTPYELPLCHLYKGYRLRWPRHLFDLGPDFWDHVLNNFSVSGKLLRSAPSIVESQFRGRPLRTFMAYALKFIGHFEIRFLRPVFGYTDYKWKWVGGWEVVIQLD